MYSTEPPRPIRLCGRSAGAAHAALAAPVSSGEASYKWTGQCLPGRAGWSALASSSDGTKLIASNGYLFTSNDSGVTWVLRANGLSLGWTAVASSADGTRLFAAASGDLYTSVDSGATWVEQTGAQEIGFSALACSSDGTRLVAADGEWGAGARYGGYLFTSDDSGVTWTRQPGAGTRNWAAVASSSDGTRLVAAVDSGYIYTSTDSGATWTEQTGAGSQNWASVACSSDGTRIIAAANAGYYQSGSYVCTSTDSGATWTQHTNLGGLSWTAVASSSDGTRLFALDDTDAYVSTDSGTTWEQHNIGNPPEPGWSSDGTTVACSSDGTRLVAANSFLGFIYTSADSGVTWTQQVSPGQASYGYAASSDGAKIVAAGGDGQNGTDYICTSTDSGATWRLEALPYYYSYWLWGTPISSSDGRTLALTGISMPGSIENGPTLLISTDFGATWIPKMRLKNASVTYSVASSSDGANLIAAECPGHISTSSDSGATWTRRDSAGNGYWQAVASSADGTRLVASADNIYTSADSGSTWRKRTGAGEGGWPSLASSSDGTRIVAAALGWCYNGYIYTSADSGATWTQQTGAGLRWWNSVACSADGTIIAAIENQQDGGLDDHLYVSWDAGATWTTQTGAGSQPWNSLWMSPDGSKIMAGAGLLFVGSVQSVMPSVDSPAVFSLTKTSAKVGATIESTGGAPVTAAGIAWGPHPNPDITGETLPDGANIGPFGVHLTGLAPNTLYHFRGYATNSQGTSYSPDATFTTLANPPTATSASGTSSTGFTANWTAPAGAAGIGEYRLDVAGDPGFHTLLAGYGDLRVSGLSQSVTGIAAGKTYYYRVRAVNAGGTSGDSKVIRVAVPLPAEIVVTSPTGGENWVAGSKHTVTWTYSGNVGSKVYIELLHAYLSIPISSGASTGKNGTGSYSWKVPASLTAEDGCRIRVTSVSNLSCSGESANTFTITNPAAP